MWVFAQKADGRVVYISGVVTGSQGQLLPQPYEACLAAALMVNAGLTAEDLAALQVQDLAEAKRIDQMPEVARLGVMNQGELTGVELDPAYTPPAAEPDSMQVRLEALEQAVARQEQAVATNLLASPHDRRWLAQKERAKLFGISWLKAHPEASMAELAVAVETDLAEQFPGQPIVVSAGIILSYAAEANARGYIPDSSFTSL
ncbi:MAG: hypothetical protein V1797_09675, partial [Pseudomonadota bacterium]